MEAFLAAVEEWPAVEALKRSFIVYPLVNALHILAIATVAVTAILMDIRVLGGFSSLPADRFVGALRPVTLAAFVVALLTGLSMFAIKASEYAENPAFRIKLVLIATASVNFLVFLRAERRGNGFDAAKLGACLSILLWISVILAGRFIAFV